MKTISSVTIDLPGMSEDQIVEEIRDHFARTMLRCGLSTYAEALEQFGELRRNGVVVIVMVGTVAKLDINLPDSMDAGFLQ